MINILDFYNKFFEDAYNKISNKGLLQKSNPWDTKKISNLEKILNIQLPIAFKKYLEVFGTGILGYDESLSDLAYDYEDYVELKSYVQKELDYCGYIISDTDFIFASSDSGFYFIRCGIESFDSEVYLVNRQNNPKLVSKTFCSFFYEKIYDLL